MCIANVKVVTLDDCCFGNVDDDAKQFKQKILILFYSLTLVCDCSDYLLNLFLFLWCCSQDPKEGGREKGGAAETHERGIFSR